MIAPMAKVQIAVPRRDRERLLTWLQEEGLLHVTPVKTSLQDNKAEPSMNTEYTLAQLQFALDFIQRLYDELALPRARSWRDFFTPRPAATVKELDETLGRLQVDDLVAKFRTISDQLGRITVEQTMLGEAAVALLPWKSLQITLEQLGGTARVWQGLASVSATEYERLGSMLVAIPTAVWQSVSRNGLKKRANVHVEIMADRSHRTSVEEALADCNAHLVNLPLRPRETVAAAAQRVATVREEAVARKLKLLSDARGLVALERDLQFAYDALLHRQEREAQKTFSLSGEHLFVIEGWLPQSDLSPFTRRLYREFPAAINVLEREAGEDVPVALINKAALRPFEAVTNIYGKPRAYEIDPSPLLSVFFLSAFGLALSDAGYGLVLMIVTGLADRFFRLKRNMRQMVQLLFYGGAATLLVGALTGGWFGITLESLPPSALRDILLALKLMDPIKSPMRLLMIAFALGGVQLLFAWTVKGYDLWRRGDRYGAIFDAVAWITMVLAIGLWAVAKQGYLPVSWKYLTLAAVLINAGVLILTQGRNHKNIFVRFGAGVASLYGLVGFTSDILSYSRLLALGLATGIIGLVVNLIGGMVADLIPVIGMAVAVVVLLAGHLFNLGINTLGAFIHAGRLQFVEFFPKFFEGGGLVYKPFGRVSKYVDNPKDYI